MTVQFGQAGLSADGCTVPTSLLLIRRAEDP